MKKLYLLTLISVLTLTTFAQDYKLGDLIEKDGITAIVVYVDESGQHGLMMSPYAYYDKTCMNKDNDDSETIENEIAPKDLYAEWSSTFDSLISCSDVYTKTKTKEYKQLWGTSYDQCMALRKDSFIRALFVDKIHQAMPKIPCHDKKWLKQIKKEKMMHLKNLLSLNGMYGQENQDNIEQYCREQGLLIEDYFPEFYWATLLGEDWFIPGKAELELMGNSIIGEISTKVITLFNFKKIKDFDTKLNYFLRNVTFDFPRLNINAYSVRYFDNGWRTNITVMSSTIIDTKTPSNPYSILNIGNCGKDGENRSCSFYSGASHFVCAFAKF